MHSKSFETFAELIGLETCIGYLVMRTELKQRFMVKKWLVPRGGRSWMPWMSLWITGARGQFSESRSQRKRHEIKHLMGAHKIHGGGRRVEQWSYNEDG
jgi:hypothetical protein